MIKCYQLNCQGALAVMAEFSAALGNLGGSIAMV